MWLTSGRATEARREAEEAVRLGARWRGRAVLGFTLLAALRTGAAHAAFERAIALDPPIRSPAGLGLARIRAGAVDEGDVISKSRPPSIPVAR
jgi:hypothetical protein